MGAPSQDIKEVQIQRIEKGVRGLFGFIVNDHVVEGLCIYIQDLIKQAPLTAFSFAHLKILKFGSTPLKHIPDEIANLTTLEELQVRACELKSISPNIGQLRNLKRLYIRDDIPMTPEGYFELPDTIGNLTTLVDLDLTWLRLRTLPATMKNLSQLRKLDLGQCEIVNLLEDFFEHMSQLEELNLTSSKLKKIPDSIGNCTKLKVLYVDGNFQEISRTIGKLKELKTLKIGSNADIGIKMLPDEFAGLSSLEEIKIRSSISTTFPPSLLKLRSLKKITISGKIATIPPEIGKLENLQVLYLSQNPIETLPDIIGNLKNLEELVVREAALHDLPKSITKLKKLKRLNLNGSRIKILPENMGSMESLEGVSMENNLLVSLPASLSLCKQLKELLIEGNAIREIPEEIRQIPGIKIVGLKKKGKVEKREERVLGKGQWAFALCIVDKNYIPTLQDLEKTLDLLHKHISLPLDLKSRIIKEYSEQILVKKGILNYTFPVTKQKFLELIKQANIPFVNWGLSNEAFVGISKEKYPRTMSGPEATYDSHFVVFGYDFGNGHWESGEYEKLEILLKQHLHEFITDFETIIGQKLKTVWDWAD